MKPEYLTLDDVDSRREIWHLLNRLPPQKRLDFLSYACRCVPKNAKGHLPEPAVWKMRSSVELAGRCDKASEVLTNEVYLDLVQLAATWDLDLLATAHELTALVRRLRV